MDGCGEANTKTGSKAEGSARKARIANFTKCLKAGRGTKAKCDPSTSPAPDREVSKIHHPRLNITKKNICTKLRN